MLLSLATGSTSFRMTVGASVLVETLDSAVTALRLRLHVAVKMDESAQRLVRRYNQLCSVVFRQRLLALLTRTEAQRRIIIKATPKSAAPQSPWFADLRTTRMVPPSRPWPCSFCLRGFAPAGNP